MRNQKEISGEDAIGDYSFLLQNIMSSKSSDTTTEVSHSSTLVEQQHTKTELTYSQFIFGLRISHWNRWTTVPLRWKKGARLNWKFRFQVMCFSNTFYLLNAR